MDLLIDKQTQEDPNDLKAAIRRHSVPISEDSDRPEDAALPQRSTISCRENLSPYVSCLLFFEEHYEKDYEEQIDQLHHIFQRANIPEGLITASIPSGGDDDDDDSTMMVLQCIQNDASLVPVLALWLSESQELSEGDDVPVHVQALRDAKEYKAQAHFSNNDHHLILNDNANQCCLGQQCFGCCLGKYCFGCCLGTPESRWDRKRLNNAKQWYFLGTPEYPWDRERLNTLAKLVRAGHAALVREALPMHVLTVVDKSTSGKDCDACVLCEISSQRHVNSKLSWRRKSTIS